MALDLDLLAGAAVVSMLLLGVATIGVTALAFWLERDERHPLPASSPGRHRVEVST